MRGPRRSLLPLGVLEVSAPLKPKYARRHRVLSRHSSIPPSLCRYSRWESWIPARPHAAGRRQIPFKGHAFQLRPLFASGDPIDQVREIGDFGDGLARLGTGLNEAIHDSPDSRLEQLPAQREGEEGVGL